MDPIAELGDHGGRGRLKHLEQPHHTARDRLGAQRLTGLLLTEHVEPDLGGLGLLGEVGGQMRHRTHGHHLALHEVAEQGEAQPAAGEPGPEKKLRAVEVVTGHALHDLPAGDGGRGRAQRVVLACEVGGERVAPERQHVTAPGEHGLLEQRGEERVEPLGQAAHPAACARELLDEPGEADEVADEHGALGFPERRERRGLWPLEDGLDVVVGRRPAKLGQVFAAVDRLVAPLLGRLHQRLTGGGRTGAEAVR